MNNPYLQQVYRQMGNETYLEKTALDPLTTAAGIHLAQNLTSRAALGSRGFAKNVAQHFHAGLQGRVQPHSVEAAPGLLGKASRAVTTIASAATPELNIVRDETYHAGRELGKHLRDAGIDPTNLPRRAQVALARASRGDFLHLKKTYADDPLVHRVLGAVQKATGHPVQDLLKGTDAGVAEAEKVWKSNVMSNNIIKAMGERANVSHLPVGESAKSTKRNLIGAAISGVIDPSATAMNTIKTVASDPRLLTRLPYGKELDKILVSKTYGQILDKGLGRGLEGQRTGKIRQAIDKYWVSPLLGESKDLANRLGVAAHTGGYQQIKAEAKKMSNRAREIDRNYGDVINAVGRTASGVIHGVRREMEPRNAVFNATNASLLAGGGLAGAGIGAASNPSPYAVSY